MTQREQKLLIKLLIAYKEQLVLQGGLFTLDNDEDNRQIVQGMDVEYSDTIIKIQKHYLLEYFINKLFEGIK